MCFWVLYFDNKDQRVSAIILYDMIKNLSYDNVGYYFLQCTAWYKH